MVVFIATCFAYGRLLLNHGHSLWVKEHYQFFPLLLVATAWLTYERAQEQAEFPATRYRITWIPLIVSWLILCAAAVFNSPWTAALSVLLLGHSLLATHKRERGLTILHPWWLLIILIPLPLGLDGELVRVLQHVASTMASHVLDFIGVMHVMSGNVLAFPDRQFFVEEACSGINSVFVMLAATSTYIVWARVRWIRGTQLLISAVWWSTAMNALRIVLIAVSHDAKFADLSEGVAHTALGLVLYLIAMWMLWSTDQLLQFVFSPLARNETNSKYNSQHKLRRLWTQLTEDAPTAEPLTTKNNTPADNSSHPKRLHRLAFMIGIAGLLQFVPHASPASKSETTRSFDNLNQQSLVADSEITDFSRTQRQNLKERNLFGANSASWSIDVPGRELRATVDGPFDTWHDLRQCYSGTGWTIVNSYADDLVTPQKTVVDALTICEMTNAMGESAHLIFAAFDTNGQTISAGSGRSIWSIQRRVLDRLQRSDKPDTMQIWQFQLLSQQAQPLSVPEQQTQLNQFMQLQSQITKQWETNE